MTTKPIPPGGYLMRLETAAKELGLEVADLLEYAEEVLGIGTRLRVCVMVPGYRQVWPAKTPLEPEPEGMKPADRRFAFIGAHANTVDYESGPGFFRKLAVERVATLGGLDALWMVDGSGMLWADGMTVKLEGLRVPREDIEALKEARAAQGDADTPPRHERDLLLCIGTLAKLLADHAPSKRFAGHKELPYNATKIAEAVHRECGRLNPKTVAGWLGAAKKLIESPDTDDE